MSVARKIILVAVAALMLLLPAAASAATEGPGSLELRDLSPSAQRIYDGVSPGVQRPRIGPIRLAAAGAGRLAVEFAVSFPGRVARPSRKRSWKPAARSSSRSRPTATSSTRLNS